ncbi:MAG: hypothetical protein KC425_04635 [Anaerolineales bacterium]|nr:hypothetical protein [Anaerolineales bacterium]
MSESLQMWMEIGFNVSYLLVIWLLVLMMWQRRMWVPAAQRPQARVFLGAFALLALGDTGHVGFRVWAYALGGLDSTITLAGRELGLVGLGALATSITVTLFYVLVLVLWQRRFEKPYGRFAYLLLAAAAVRLLLHLLPQNAWNSPVPPQPWSLIRNLPLMLQGLGVAYLILRDAWAAADRTYTWIGVMILVSYAFYMPVIFFVQRVPMLGMLMIPKTLAYVAIAFIGYGAYYRRRPGAEQPLPAVR